MRKLISIYALIILSAIRAYGKCTHGLIEQTNGLCAKLKREAAMPECAIGELNHNGLCEVNLPLMEKCPVHAEVADGICYEIFETLPQFICKNGYTLEHTNECILHLPTRKKTLCQDPRAHLVGNNCIVDVLEPRGFSMTCPENSVYSQEDGSCWIVSNNECIVEHPTGQPTGKEKLKDLLSSIRRRTSKEPIDRFNQTETPEILQESEGFTQKSDETSIAEKLKLFLNTDNEEISGSNLEVQSSKPRRSNHGTNSSDCVHRTREEIVKEWLPCPPDMFVSEDQTLCIGQTESRSIEVCEDNLTTFNNSCPELLMRTKADIVCPTGEITIGGRCILKKVVRKNVFCPNGFAILDNKCIRLEEPVWRCSNSNFNLRSDKTCESFYMEEKAVIDLSTSDSLGTISLNY